MSKADDLQVQERVRAIITWYLNGYFTKDIIAQITASWPTIGERQAYKYLKKAKDEIKKLRSKDLEEKLEWHQATRLKLYNQLEGKKTSSGVFAAMYILKDMAKIDNVYPADKHEHRFEADTVVTVGKKVLSKE